MEQKKSKTLHQIMRSLHRDIGFFFIGLTIVFTLSGIMAKAQPIPVELMMGNNYGTVNFSFNKNFSPTSRFGFSHLNTVQFDYKDKNKNSFILQNLIYVETIKNLRVAGGVAYSLGGFNATAGLQYSYSGEKLIIRCTPRVNIKSNPSYNVMTILQYKPKINDHAKLFTRIQLLNIFDDGGNIKSYQWMRLGLEVKRIQFGLAANLDEIGPNPTVESNLGLFIRKEIF